MWLLCKVVGSIIASGLLWLQLLLSKCINEVFFFPHSCFAINPFELILKSLQLFWRVYKTQTHHYLNESFACRQPDCLHSFPSCIKALHSIPAELRSTHVQLFISLCQEFSLASTCQYPPQIGRQAHIWHMVQSSAAFPSLFSWPASTPEEHGNTCWHAHSQTDTHSQSQIHIQTPLMQHICQFCMWEPPTHWVAGHLSTNYLQQVSGFSTVALYLVQQPNHLRGWTSVGHSDMSQWEKHRSDGFSTKKSIYHYYRSSSISIEH